MDFDQLWQRFLNDGIASLSTDEIENMLYFQYARIKQLERGSATAVRMSGVTAGEINISGVSVTNHPR